MCCVHHHAGFHLLHFQMLANNSYAPYRQRQIYPHKELQANCIVCGALLVDDLFLFEIQRFSYDG
jgi:hypothetical protein